MLGCLFVCLYVRLNLTNTLTDLPQILIGEHGKSTKVFLAWFSLSLVVWVFKGKTPAKAGLLSLFVNIQEKVEVLNTKRDQIWYKFNLDKK